MLTLEELRYPVGKMHIPDEISQEDVIGYLETLQEFPSKVRKLWNDLPVALHERPYREGGWNARQVIHHLADSHMNAFIRIRLTLTEEIPVIKPYKESLWAELPDVRKCDPGVSIDLLTSLHHRLVILLKNLSSAELDRKYFHPESKREFTIRQAMALYDWHCRHHFGHLEIIRNSN